MLDGINPLDDLLHLFVCLGSLGHLLIINYMNRKKKPKFNPIDELPTLHPEPDYIVKTRPPMWGKQSESLRRLATQHMAGH